MQSRLSLHTTILTLLCFALAAKFPSSAAAQDCNNNGVPDLQDINPADPDGDGEVSEDCNANLIPDECELPQFLQILTPNPGDSTFRAFDADGDRIVVGSPYDSELAQRSGAALIFEKSGGSWTQVDKLTVIDAHANHYVGLSVAVDGDTIVVGTPRDNDFGTDSGAAYVFEKINGIWTETAKLTASDAAPDDEFGSSVAVDGETIVVGVPEKQLSGIYFGAAYVFEKNNGMWQQSAKLVSNNVEDHDFGFAVDADGGIITIGAPGYINSSNTIGRVFIYEQTDDIWIESAVISYPGSGGRNLFGAALSIQGDLLVVGAFRQGIPLQDAGAVYVFRNEGGIWNLESELHPTIQSKYEYFGGSVALLSGTIAVGCFSENSSERFGGVTVYFFRSTPSGWNQVGRVQSPTGDNYYSGFGINVAFTNEDLVIGSLNESVVLLFSASATGSDCLGDYSINECRADCDSNGVPDICDIKQGLASDCNLNGIPDECEIAYGLLADCNDDEIPDSCSIALSSPVVKFNLLPDEIESDDRFGSSLATNGETILVGAYNDDGIGAAYFFSSSGQEYARIVPFDGATGDNFGGSVAIEGNLAVIGASGDDDNGNSSGSAYVFRRIENIWQLDQKIIGMDTDQFDRFGSKVVIDQNRIAVSSPSKAIYIFVEQAGQWQQTHVLPSIVNPGFYDNFGQEFALNGDILAAGAPNAQNPFADTGIVSVFEFSDGMWNHTATLSAPRPTEYGYFGISVAITDSHIAVADYYNDDFGPELGAVRLFRKTDNEWEYDRALIAVDSPICSAFGYQLAANGDNLAVSMRELSESQEQNIQVAIFQFLNDEWRQVARVQLPASEIESYWYTNLALDYPWVVVGNHDFDVNGPRSGFARLFDISVITSDCDGNNILDDCQPDISTVAGFVGALLSDSIDAFNICLFDLNRDQKLDGRDVDPFVQEMILP